MELILPKPGKYVLAVSGGVDSMVLLDVLLRRPDLELTVAHFDHGIRPDSAADRRFVERAARTYGLPFVYEEGQLGSAAGEAAARQARYDFLQRVKREAGARAIITAHHQDDVLETAIINLLRGTGRKGLTALRGRPGLSRPLLAVPKSELIGYARRHHLQWREDPTNAKLDYLRNYVRHKLLARIKNENRAELVSILAELTLTNRELDKLLQGLLARQPSGKLDRAAFIQLPHQVAREVMASWLRVCGVAGFDSKTLERLTVAAKTAAAGKRFPATGGATLEIGRNNLALTGLER